jgi:hypothetical protein
MRTIYGANFVQGTRHNFRIGYFWNSCETTMLTKALVAQQEHREKMQHLTHTEAVYLSLVLLLLAGIIFGAYVVHHVRWVVRVC